MTENPQLSVKQLADYLSSSSSQRKTILKQAKFPQSFIVRWHERSRAAIIKFLVSHERDQRALATEIAGFKDRLSAGGFSSDQAERMARADYSVLDQFHRNLNALNLGGLSFSGWEGPRPKNNINGVEIPIPVSLLQFRKIGSKSYCGGASLLLTASPSSEAERKRHCQLAASLIWRGLRDTMTMDVPPHTKLCLCVDVTSGVTYEAPASQVRRQAEIEDACEEILLRWPHV